MRTNPLASTAIMLLACAPKSPDQIVDELQGVARGPLMYPASVCDSVPFQLVVGLDAVPEITEEQVAEEMKRLISKREREVRQYETELPVSKPRSKRGQRVRRWR